MQDPNEPTLNGNLGTSGDDFRPATSEENCAERNRAEAFLAFHTRNYSRLSAFVHTLVPVWQDAEEIIQDTLVVLWKKFDQFDPSTSFFAWAARVAQYEVLNYRRRKSRQVVVLDDDVLDAVAKTAAREMDDIDLHREALERCLEKLPERDREILRLRYQEGGSIHIAASAVHRTTGHVQRLLRTIRAGLIRCINLSIAGRGI